VLKCIRKNVSPFGLKNADKIINDMSDSWNCMITANYDDIPVKS
jgi:hypothetical protein